jgi:hypothetical protein
MGNKVQPDHGTRMPTTEAEGKQPTLAMRSQQVMPWGGRQEAPTTDPDSTTEAEKKKARPRNEDPADGIPTRASRRQGKRGREVGRKA